MKKIISIALLIAIMCNVSCGSKKHTNCDAYGNKSGQIKTVTIKRA